MAKAKKRAKSKSRGSKPKSRLESLKIRLGLKQEELTDIEAERTKHNQRLDDKKAKAEAVIADLNAKIAALEAQQPPAEPAPEGAAPPQTPPA